jgi:hypothetical protein
MSVSRSRSDRRGAPEARRSFLKEAGAALLALPLLLWGRSAVAQAVYYDQYGQPVTVAPGAVVTPAAPATVPPPGYSNYGPAGVVGQTRRVARRTSRRTGRREGVREDMWDAID